MDYLADGEISVGFWDQEREYLEARHAAGASPATIRLARAAVAKVHQVSGAADPAADGLVTDVPQAHRP